MATYIMSDKDFEIANQMARALVSRKTDPNEVAKCVGFVTKQPDGAVFFEYLDTVIYEGRAVVRSGQTLDYYRDIREACQKHLTDYVDKPGKLALILGWTVRLMRYYAVQDVPKTQARLPQSQPAQVSKATIPTGERHTGRVKFFKADQGFGFIAPDAGGKDVYVNQRDVASGTLRVGQRVSYIEVPGNKGPQARDVKPD